MGKADKKREAVKQALEERFNFRKRGIGDYRLWRLQREYVRMICNHPGVTSVTLISEAKFVPEDVLYPRV